MEKHWFLLCNEKISGPHSAEEIEEQAKRTEGNLQIWGRGANEWYSLTAWRTNLAKFHEVQKKSESDHPTWRLRIEGRESTPMTYSEMLKKLRTMTDFSAVDVLMEGFSTWRELYAIQKLADDLGITRRSHPRVPIMGTFQGEFGTRTLHARIISISEGGLGITEAPGVQIGDQIRGSITSPNLFMAINCTCEVTFVGQDGYAGLKFTTIPMDAKSSIIAYVNKFVAAS